MAEMVASAGVQEAVSRGVSLVIDNLEEKASKKNYMERLQFAHTELEFAMERSRRLPIIEFSLQRQRRNLKRIYEECGGVLQRRKLRVLEQDEAEAQQGVTVQVQSSSLPRKVIHAVKTSIASWLGFKEDDELSCSNVKRFEFFAKKAGKFVRDVESGCSLSHYRFHNPLTRNLFQMKTLWSSKVQGSQSTFLFIEPMFSEERGGGLEAWIAFCCQDLMTQKANKGLFLIIRLSDSTDIVATMAQCLKLLQPVFKSFAGAAIGQITELTSESNYPSLGCSFKDKTWYGPPDPLCCTGVGADNTATSNRFPSQVLELRFRCSSVPAIQLQRAGDRANINVVKDWPTLDLTFRLMPHHLSDEFKLYTVKVVELLFLHISDPDIYQAPTMEMLEEGVAYELFGSQVHEYSSVGLRETEEMVLAKGIDRFICQSELTTYQMKWFSQHGEAFFYMKRPIKRRTSHRLTRIRNKH